MDGRKFRPSSMETPDSHLLVHLMLGAVPLLGLESTILDALPLVVACFLCPLMKPLSSRGLGDTLHLAPKPIVGTVVEA